MINIIHWSDTHVGESPTREAALASLVAHALDNYHPHDTVIVITGDVTHNGALAEYRRAARILGKLTRHAFTVLIAPGNHDCGPMGLKWSDEASEAFDVELWGKVCPGKAPARWPIVHTFGNVRFIILDSCEGNADEWMPGARGELGTAQLARLEVAMQDELPATVVALHHHPIKADLLHALPEAESLTAILGRRAVPLLLFGHMHRRGVWRGHQGIGIAADAGSTTATVAGHYVYTLYRMSDAGEVQDVEVRVRA